MKKINYMDQFLKTKLVNYLKENDITIHSDDIDMNKLNKNPYRQTHEVTISPYPNISLIHIFIKVNKN